MSASWGPSGRINHNRVGSQSPTRECVNCGQRFRVPLVKHRDGSGRPALTYSRRKTCGRTCASDLKSQAAETAIRRLTSAEFNERMAKTLAIGWR